MKLNLFPHDESFQEMFSRASKNVVKAATTFKLLVEKWNPEDEKIEVIHELEKEGDRIRHELVDKLNRTFITPIDREDIYALSGELDDIVDMIQATTDRMKIYRINRSDKGLMQLAEILEKATILLDKAIEESNDKKNVRRVLDYFIEINQLENEGDNLFKQILGNLFDNGAAGHALEVVKWKDTYEAIEAAIDKCEDVACTVESVIVKGN